MFPDVDSDLLRSFGTDDFFMNVARVGMAVVYSIIFLDPLHTFCTLFAAPIGLYEQIYQAYKTEFS